jgi:hypothetical protein
MKMTTSCSLRAYPSVKGIYMAIFLMYITASTFSQSSKWEFGIGLRPLTMKEEPYSFIFKRVISRSIALRMGVSFKYGQNSQNIFYSSTNPTNRLIYDYIEINKNMYANGFLGFQYSIKLKKFENLYIYGATDIQLGFKTENSNIGGDGLIHYGDVVKLLPNQYVETGYLRNHKTTKLGLRQSIGVIFFINSSFSISIEGGMLYEYRRLVKDGDVTFIIGSDGLNPNPIIGSIRDFLHKDWNYTLLSSPLTLLSFNYHF